MQTHVERGSFPTQHGYVSLCPVYTRVYRTDIVVTGSCVRELLPTNGMVGCMITSIYGAVNAFLEWTTHDGDMEKGAVLRVHSGFPSGLL